MSGRSSRGRRDDNNPRNKSSSWSSDETGSVYSGGSIDTHVDDRVRRGQRRTAAGDIFTHGEESRIRRSLQRKLLSNNGARLSGIERRLLRADHPRKGAVSVSTFKAALAADSRSDNGADIRRDEVLWLIQSLKGRNGKNVAILKMRELLQQKESGGGRRSASRGGAHVDRRRRDRDRCHTARSSSSVPQGGERRRRRDESTTDEDGEDWAGRRGRTTSESDSSNGPGGAAFQRQLSPPPPARWAIRQGTVGQWLHEVAAPMERKLFFEFMKDLTAFEVRNGLDHYRVRPSQTTRRHGGFDDEASGAARRCGEGDGTTILHLGPMLKASIRFYV